MEQFSAPVTMVHTQPDGTLYAFARGLGLLSAPEGTIQWAVKSNGFGDEVMLHLALTPGGMFAVTVSETEQFLNVSRDEGRTWARVE